MLYIVVVIPLLAFFCFNFRKCFLANTYIGGNSSRANKDIAEDDLLCHHRR